MAVASKTADMVSNNIVELETPVQNSESEIVTVGDIVGKDTPGTPIQSEEEGTSAAAAIAAVTKAEDAATEEAKAEGLEAAPTAEAVDPDLLDFAKQLKSEWETDPAKMTSDIWDKLSQKDQEKFLKHITSRAEEAKQFTPFEDSEIEKAIAPVMGDLVAYPEWKGRVEEAFNSHAQFINDAHLRMECANAALQTFAEMFGAKLPDADFDGMMKALRGGKDHATVTKAYRAELAKMASTMKQGMKNRPADTTSTSNDTPVFSASDSIAERLKKAKAAGLKIG